MRKTSRLANGLVALLLAARPGLAADGATPCAARYGAGVQFPPATESAETLTGAKLRQLLGNKGWGLIEDVTPRSLPDAPATLVLEVKLPKGSIDHKNTEAPMGGMGFRWRPGMPVGSTAACLSYSLYFAPGFPFNKGGKLPGLFGGDGPAGGKDVDGQSGFSTRYMWRAKGQGEVYAYIPGKPDGRGLSIDRGAWTFPQGQWVRMEQEVVLNTPGQPDGRLHVWVDGVLKLSHDDVLYRSGPALGIDGVMADIFFGGKTVEWAAPADTYVRLTPFTLAWR